MAPAFGGVPDRSASCVVASPHSSESARVSKFSPSAWCTTTVVPESSGTRNSVTMRCSTLKTGLSAGNRSPKLVPVVVSGRYGISTVRATAAATQPTRTIQRSVMTMKRYPLPRPEEITEAARPSQDPFPDCTARSHPTRSTDRRLWRRLRSKIN
jgi:hypothetical protein